MKYIGLLIMPIIPLPVSIVWIGISLFLHILMLTERKIRQKKSVVSRLFLIAHLAQKMVSLLIFKCSDYIVELFPSSISSAILHLKRPFVM